MSRHEPTTFSDALSEAISRRRLSLDALSRELRALGTPVSIATLSYWQTGRSLPARARSLEAVTHLEGLLALPPSTLLRTLPQVDPGSLWDPRKVIGAEARVQAVLDELDIDLGKDFTKLCVHDTVRVSADGLVLVQETHLLVRSTVEAIDRYPVMASEAIGEGYEAPGLEAARGCTMGRLRIIEDANTVVGELLLGRTLARDEMAAFGYRTTWQSPTTPDTIFERVISVPVHFQSMTIIFEGQAPTRAWRTFRPTAATADDEITRTPLEAGSTVQIVLSNVRPGVHGIAWDLPGEGATPQADERATASPDGRQEPSA